MTETRGFYTPEPVSGTPSLTEIINKWAAGTTVPDAVQAQARVAELEAALSEIEAITAGGPYSLQWLLRVLRRVHVIARSARGRE